jgi:hypothetical protein
MRKLCISLALAAASLPGLAATNVGVSVGIDQPGVYGRIDIGRVSAPPVLVYPQPVVIVPTPVVRYQSPIYLHVPPPQVQDWRRYCDRYGACNRPVYFVQEDWYHNQYHGYSGKAGKHHKHKKQKKHGKGHGHD